MLFFVALCCVCFFKFIFTNARSAQGTAVRIQLVRCILYTRVLSAKCSNTYSSVLYCQQCT